MLKQKIKVLVLTAVGGPKGKLKAGSIVELEDSNYTRLLIKSGTVSLIDPPSLDPEFLERGDYELQEGFSYDEMKKAKAQAEETKKAAKKTIKIPKRPEPVKAEAKTEEDSPKETASEETIREGENLGEILEEGHPEARGPEPKKEGNIVSGSEENLGDILEEGHPEARGPESTDT